jgi:hypothetical protein
VAADCTLARAEANWFFSKVHGPSQMTTIQQYLSWSTPEDLLWHDLMFRDMDGAMTPEMFTQVLLVPSFLCCICQLFSVLPRHHRTCAQCRSCNRCIWGQHILHNLLRCRTRTPRHYLLGVHLFRPCACEQHDYSSSPNLHSPPAPTFETHPTAVFVNILPHCVHALPRRHWSSSPDVIHRFVQR